MPVPGAVQPVLYTVPHFRPLDGRFQYCFLLKSSGAGSDLKNRPAEAKAHLAAVTEEAVGWNTKKWPRKGAKSAEVLVFLRLLRLFAAIQLVPPVVYATDFSVMIATV